MGLRKWLRLGESKVCPGLFEVEGSVRPMSLSGRLCPGGSDVDSSLTGSELKVLSEWV